MGQPVSLLAPILCPLLLAVKAHEKVTKPALEAALRFYKAPLSQGRIERCGDWPAQPAVITWRAELLPLCPRLYLKLPHAADIVFVFSRRQLESCAFHVRIEILTYFGEGSMLHAPQSTKTLYVFFASVSLKIEQAGTPGESQYGMVVVFYILVKFV